MRSLKPVLLAVAIVSPGGAAAMTPPAAAAPNPLVVPVCQPPSWMIFFDRGSAALDAEALQILASFPTFMRERGLDRLELVGSADTVGSAAGAQALSLRRAEAVATALVALGVPAERIVLRAVGDTALLLPTGDGVDERLNRNVMLYPDWEHDTGC